MSRLTYGLDTQGPTIVAGRFAGNVALTFWTSSAGSSQITDLLNAAMNPVTSITSNNDGTVPQFSGPASGQGSSSAPGMWVNGGGAELLFYTPQGGITTSSSTSASGIPTVQTVYTSNKALTGLPGASPFGYTPIATDTVMLQAQSTSSQNGPWVVASGAWSRPTWFLSGVVATDRQVCVMGGTNAGQIYVLTGTGAITVDTTAETWVTPFPLISNNASEFAAATVISNLGLGALATLAPSGTGSAINYLRGDGTWAEIPQTFIFNLISAAISTSPPFPGTSQQFTSFVCALTTQTAPSGSSLTGVLRYSTNGGSTWTNIQSLSITSGSTTPSTATASVTVASGALLDVNWTSVGSGTAATGAVYSATAT